MPGAPLPSYQNRFAFATTPRLNAQNLDYHRCYHDSVLSMYRLTFINPLLYNILVPDTGFEPASFRFRGECPTIGPIGHYGKDESFPLTINEEVSTS